MNVEHVQYDGSGDWVDITFSDGERFRFTASELDVARSEIKHFREEIAAQNWDCGVCGETIDLSEGVACNIGGIRVQCLRHLRG